MAILGKTPFTSIQDYRVAVDAPVSTDLVTDIAVDINYLKSAISDGAFATQGINGSTLTLAGYANIGGDANVAGALTAGSFDNPDSLNWIFDT